MANKSQYRTKQMAEILSYLQSMQGSHVTVHDIHAYFKSKNISVGTTTIYRHLDRMVAEGIVPNMLSMKKAALALSISATNRIVIPPSAFTANAKNAAS